MNILKNILFPVMVLLTFRGCNSQESHQPNIVIIYADDMGYGDLACQNPETKIPTPFLDRLASEGMRFTDAHSSSGICSPSRFALLTGQYHWRRTHNIVNSFGPPMFKDGDITLPQVLRDAGYTTACFGKWHLGWDWAFINEEPSGERTYWGNTRKVYLVEDIDWSSPVTGGPLERGFDHYFGDGTINFPPYAWVDGDRFIDLPDGFFEFDGFDSSVKEGEWDSRPGPMVKGWDPYKVLPTLTSKVVEWIQIQEAENPFFLYFALPSPHTPVIPNEEFVGKSEAGGYGDFMFQTDWVAGQVLNALKEKGFEENTIVIFSSDNGPERLAFGRGEKYGHFSMGKFRGLKRDVWEGGHHVPFIVKWPAQIEAGSVSDELISQIDIMATLAAVINITLPENAAPDSRNFLPVWAGKKYPSTLRKTLVHNTYKGHWGLRQRKWLYINKPSGEVSKMPESFKKLRGYTDFDSEGLLFDLEKDPEQRLNLFGQYPEKVEQMKDLLNDHLEEMYTADY